MSIELSGLGKTYQADEWVLHDVSARIASGEFFAIVGPSGCGKSTLLRMIAGLTPITAGNLRINERVVTDLPPKDRQLTMVFQSYALFPFLTVQANVAFGLRARKVPTAEIDQRVARAIQLVGLGAFRDRKPRDLSGGQRQRVALARAIASQAKLCLMDEPLSNLDAQLRVKMRTELRRLQQRLGLTVIYVTHDQVEAMTMADHIMVLHDHQVQQIGTPLELYNHPANTFVGGFFGAPRMNLLPARVSGTTELTLAQSLKVALPRPLPVADYTVGIRPNAITVLPVGTGTSCATVQTVEYLGAQTLLETQLVDGTALEVIGAAHTVYRPGDRVAIRLTGTLYIFDAQGRARLTMKEGVGHGNHAQDVSVVAQG